MTVRKMEKRRTECRQDSVAGLYIGVAVREEKRKEDKVFLDVFTETTDVFEVLFFTNNMLVMKD